jgi:hypothetical protein
MMTTKNRKKRSQKGYFQKSQKSCSRRIKKMPNLQRNPNFLLIKSYHDLQKNFAPTSIYNKVVKFWFNRRIDFWTFLRLRSTILKFLCIFEYKN